MRVECSRAWQIDALGERRLGPQDVESFERHRQLCATCAARVADNQRLRELARALPRRGPTELELRRVRARVMRDASVAGSPKTKSVTSRMAAITLALAAVALTAWSVAKQTKQAKAPVVAVASAATAATRAVAAPTAAAPYAGFVVPSSDAGWSQTRVGHVERVHLEAGTLTVRVRPQQPDERFLVELPDGELEVRGTTFAVTVRGGVTTQVRVDEGKVDLRMAGRPAFTLNSNDVWPPALPIAPARAHRAPVPTTRVITQVPHVPGGAAGGADVSRIADDESARYSDAVDLLRAGKYDDAANAFHVFAAGRQQATQAEDASYLEAVALARAGRFDAAALVAEHHLDSFPQSFHRKEASILVARAARVRGDCDKAREALAPWRDAMPDAEARALLRMCFR